MIGRIKEALTAYETLKPSLPNDRTSQTLSRIASYFRQVVEADVESRKKTGVNVLASLKPAKNELSALFGAEAIGEDKPAGKVYKILTQVLDGTAYSFK